MPFHFQFRRYRLPLRVSVRTAHEIWTEREGIIVRLQDEQGAVRFGEIAPIPAFGTETVDAAEEACRLIGEWPAERQLREIPQELGCVRNGVNAALGELRLGAAEAVKTDNVARAVAALLPAGRPAMEQAKSRAESGFRTFKWKVGVADIGDELALLDDLCAVLPAGSKLRLDANGAWDRRQAERWLERCAERPIEFVEQPCFASASLGPRAVQRVEDALLGLAHDYPTPLALDESLVRDGDVERWIGRGWPGWYVVKPTLLGDVNGALARLKAVRATVVFSSALETALGARAALTAALSWDGEPKALGFGVWPLFKDGRFDGPLAAPFCRPEDVARIDPEAVWNALN